jgi:RNA polymerase sigma factor (sigma-70 family)
MMKTEAMEAAIQSDAELVAESLAGNKDAFRQIIERYQTLICSLAYSATGSLSRSEDLAQETFVTAWKDSAELREPPKLRNWLCAIVRFRIGKQFRRQDRDPIHSAEPLEVVAPSAAPEPTPSAQAITNEETIILWRSLERIPQMYREPLVLFYREHQSIETVAMNLELTEDAVKQRLSRGRKILQEEVLAFVEGALTRTNPGPIFTLGVVAALPAMVISAKATTLGAAAKGGATAAGAGAIGMLGAILCPLLAFLNVFRVWRISHQAARSNHERKLYNIFYPVLAGSIVAVIWLITILMTHGDTLIKTNPSRFVGLIAALILGYPLLLIPFCVWYYRAVKKVGLEMPPVEAPKTPENLFWEYRSRFQLFGLPFVHLRTGGWQRGRPLGELKPVKAWIAADDAFGVLFAYGSVAVAPVSVGACAIGLISYGAMAVGALAVGGFGFGIWAFAGFGFGWQTSAGIAIAWNTASGAQYAIAHYFALAPIAHAAQANTEFVRQLVRSNPFFKVCWMFVPYFLWLMWLWSVPMMITQGLAFARRHRRKS